MAKTAENYKKWRMSRRCAGVARRSYVGTHANQKTALSDE